VWACVGGGKQDLSELPRTLNVGMLHPIQLKDDPSLFHSIKLSIVSNSALKLRKIQGRVPQQHNNVSIPPKKKTKFNKL
jgi:hypothetical protein